MAKARKKKAKKTPRKKAPAKTKAKKPTKKVYHIFHFPERFEIKDKYGKFITHPLLFTRDFVGSGIDDESVHFVQQMMIARQSENYHILHSVFGELKTISANRSLKYRGYILEGTKPVTKKIIAQLVKLPLEKCTEILNELEQIGLIEYVPLPDFDNIPPGKPAEKPDKKPKKTGGRKKSGATGKRSRATATGRKKSGATGSGRDSFQERETGNGNGNGKTKSKEKKNNIPEPGKTKGKAKSKTKALHRQVTDKIKEMREQDKAPAPGNPTSPGNPTRSDAGEGKQQAGCLGNPHPSITASDAQTQRFIEAVLNEGRSDYVYSPEAKQFGAVVFIALEVPYDPYSQEGRSELCCYAKGWDDALGMGLSSKTLTELWELSIVDAKGIAKKRGKVKWRKSAEATWRYTFNRRLGARARAKAG